MGIDLIIKFLVLTGVVSFAIIFALHRLFISSVDGAKQRLEKVRRELVNGSGVRHTARVAGVSPATAHAVKVSMIGDAVGEAVSG